MLWILILSGMLLRYYHDFDRGIITCIIFRTNVKEYPALIKESDALPAM